MIAAIIAFVAFLVGLGAGFVCGQLSMYNAYQDAIDRDDHEHFLRNIAP